MKRILDTVHGHILIEEEFMEKIVDTPHFQRLRHIDQSAIRSIFPCARHDRFIHSLGVFHLGKKVVETLTPQMQEVRVEEKRLNKLTKTFLVACLLHDIGHAPFSHTFEKYFGLQEDLAKQLNNITGIEIVKPTKEKSTNYHEYTSAIISWNTFGNVIDELGGRPELVVRMITGQKYDTDVYSLEDCFIELLHGKIVDVDRMDYACRDVWASGYSTSSIDVNRLINSIKLSPEGEKWEICYHPSVINEIESLLKVREFQNRYVFGHHTVVYDQYLLVEAMEYWANKNDGTDSIFTIENLGEEGKKFRYLSDGDIISCMKQDKENKFFNEWYSRNYEYFPLWKTLMEFNHYFPFLKGKNLSAIDLKKLVSEFLEERKISEYRICEVKIKEDEDLSELKLLLNEEKRRLNEIYEFYVEPREEKTYYYVYLGKKYEGDKVAIINDLKSLLLSLKEKQDKEFEELNSAFGENS